MHLATVKVDQGWEMGKLSGILIGPSVPIITSQTRYDDEQVQHL